MKKLLRSLLAILASIYLLASIIPGFSYSDDIKILLIASGAFWLVSLVGKPVIKLAMLPINVLTLGLFSWATNLILLFITTKLVNGFYITGFDYPAWSWGEVSVSAGKVTTFWTALLVAISLSALINFLEWVCDD